MKSGQYFSVCSLFWCPQVAKHVEAALKEPLPLAFGRGLIWASSVLQVFRALGGVNGEKRRGGLHLARPKSPNMQELKRRFRQVLSSKVKSATTL